MFAEIAEKQDDYKKFYKLISSRFKVCFAQAVVNEHTLESRGFDYVPYSRVLVGYSRIRGWTRQPHIMLLFGDDRVRQMTEEINESHQSP